MFPYEEDIKFLHFVQSDFIALNLQILKYKNQN